MRNKQAIFFVCAAVVAATVWTATAAMAAPPDQWLPAAEANKILAQIKTREASIKTAVAEFTQHQTTPMFTQPITTTGRAHVDTTGKMRVDLLGDAPMVMLVDAGWLYMHFPDMDKTTRKRIGFAKNTLATTFGYGLPVSELTRRFHVKVATMEKGAAYRLLMTPRQAQVAARIESIDIHVPQKSLLPERIAIRMPGESTLSIQVTKLTINKPLPTNIFNTDGWTIEDDSTPAHGELEPGDH